MDRKYRSKRSYPRSPPPSTPRTHRSRCSPSTQDDRRVVKVRSDSSSSSDNDSTRPYRRFNKFGSESRRVSESRSKRTRDPSTSPEPCERRRCRERRSIKRRRSPSTSPDSCSPVRKVRAVSHVEAKRSGPGCSSKRREVRSYHSPSISGPSYDDTTTDDEPKLPKSDRACERKVSIIKHRSPTWNVVKKSSSSSSSEENYPLVTSSKRLKQEATSQPIKEERISPVEHCLPKDYSFKTPTSTPVSSNRYSTLFQKPKSAPVVFDRFVSSDKERKSSSRLYDHPHTSGKSGMREFMQTSETIYRAKDDAMNDSKFRFPLTDLRLKLTSPTASSILNINFNSPVSCCTPNRKHAHATPQSLPAPHHSNCHSSPAPRRRSDTFTFSGGASRSSAPWSRDFTTRSRGYKHTFIDSHCHIDFTYKQMNVDMATTYQTFRESMADSYPENYEGCVAVFCNPNTFSAKFPKDSIFRTVSGEDGVWLALGCHPKSATDFKDIHEQGLRKYLSHPKVVALGEIGLDYSGTFHRHADVQKRVFRTQLKIALEMDLPLVIHCRDADEDCLEIMHELVPRNHKIHLHCFTRNEHKARHWLDSFPNMYLGLTPVITYQSAVEPMTVAARIPLDRLLLETDAPYFVPGSIKGKLKVSHPGLALITAERIAELRGVSVDVVLKATRQNTRNMYGI